MSDLIKFPTDPAAGLGTGRNGSIDAAGGEVSRTRLTSSDRQIDGKVVIERRHVDFLEHQIRWRWLLDSYEGGDRYRNAVYGPDRKGLPCRNLFRHRREYPDPQQFPVVYGGFAGGLDAVSGEQGAIGFGPYPGMLGADSSATAQDDDYELRRARTPVPEFVAEAVEIHLSKVYDQEVTRDGPEDLVEWWKDVDGRGTPIDDWMRETVAPLLLVLGCLDICFDHPRRPPGEVVNTRADELRLGLDRCVASYILPQNMVWWRCDAAGRYTECLVREYVDPSERIDRDAKGNAIDTDEPGGVGDAWRKNYVRYRHWTATDSTLYNFSGDEVLERLPHSFGRVPIVRLVDLKKHRTPTIGKSRYEAIAELQREFYNRDSELILSDTLQAHPLLSGPEDYCKADNTLSIGPGYVLPKKKNTETGSYEGWEYTSPPKDPAESLRHNKDDLREMVDRRACLTKPAGAKSGHGGGAGGSVVAQSGISKVLDAQAGHKLLASIAKSLAKAERFIAEFACLVLRGRVVTTAERGTIKVIYPARFELYNAAELLDGLTRMQQSFGTCGESPITESRCYQSVIRQLLLGLGDEEYAEMDREIVTMLERHSPEKKQLEGRPPIGIEDDSEALEGKGSAEQDAGTDPTGQSAGTMVANMIPSVQ
jgi:hypothetical protein